MDDKNRDYEDIIEETFGGNLTPRILLHFSKLVRRHRVFLIFWLTTSLRKFNIFSEAYLRVSKNDGGTSTAVSLPNLFDAVIRSYDLDLQ